MDFEADWAMMSMTDYGTGLHTIVSDPYSFMWQNAVYQGNIYWYDPGYGAIYSVSLLGGGLTELSSQPASAGGDNNAFLGDIVVVNGTVFWSDDRNSTSALYAVSVNGGPTEKLYGAGNLTLVEDIADAGQNVAFGAWNAETGNVGIYLVPKSGGTVTTLVNNVYQYGIAVSGDYLYFSANNLTSDTINVAQLPPG